MQGLAAAQGPGPSLSPAILDLCPPRWRPLHDLLRRLAITQLIAWHPLLSHRCDRKATTTSEGDSLRAPGIHSSADHDAAPTPGHPKFSKKKAHELTSVLPTVKRIKTKLKQKQSKLISCEKAGVSSGHLRLETERRWERSRRRKGE